MKAFIYLVLLVVAVVLAMIVWDRYSAPPAPLAKPPAPAPAAANTAPMPAAGPGAPAGSTVMSRRPMIEQAARSTKVTIATYSESGSSVTVQVNWKGDVATLGGDFLDACIRVGMRDFDTINQSKGLDKDRRTMWSATYRLKF